jgi:hypothetical protein
LNGGDDGIIGALLIGAEIGAGGVGGKHDVGGISLLEGFGEGGCIGNIRDKYFRTVGCQRLEVSCIPADRANFLAAGKKSFSYHVSSVAACS